MELNKSKRKVWQLAGGPVNRSYAELFLKHGVGLIGPGDAGPWRSSRSDKEFDGSFVRRFAKELDIDDMVLLRTGSSTICAVGIVANEYMYLNQFDDVNGWDLQHARRIRWCRLPQEYTFEGSIFGANPPRFSRTWHEEVLDYAERFLNSPPLKWQSAPLPKLPSEEPELEDIPTKLQPIIAQAHDLTPLYLNKDDFGDHPTEDELVAHFVIPFLRALGWPPEWIAIKWRHMDVVVFKKLPRISENCKFVIEAKRFGFGFESALEQAKGYISSMEKLIDIVVTDGIRYRMYSSESDFEPVAYANLTRLKDSATKLFSKMKKP